MKSTKTFFWILLIAGVLLKPCSAAISCSITGAAGVTFGNYDVLSASDKTGLGLITYSCSGGSTTVTITLSQGGSGLFTPRKLAGVLQYNLYLDSAYTQIWGDGTSGTLKYTKSGSNPSASVTIYGKIPKSQDVSAATDNDSVTVTITHVP